MFKSCLKMLLISAIFAQCLGTPLALAQSILTTTPGSKIIQGIKIAQSGSVTIEGRTTNLVTIAAGLRKKTLVVPLNVYVLQVLVSESKTNVLASVNSAKVVVLYLNFLRTVEAVKIQNSFRDGLVANGVDLKDSSISAFLNAVAEKGDATENGSMVMAFEKLDDGSEKITYESTKLANKTINAPAGTAQKIINIWFAKSADNGLADLKAVLLAGLN